MKILFVSPMYYPAIGGAELYLKELAEGLALRGHEVTVITANVADSWGLGSGKFGGLPGKEIINRVKVVRLDLDGFMSRTLEKWIARRGGYRSLSWLLTSEGCEMLLQHPRVFSGISYVLGQDADIVVSMNWYWPPSYHTYLARKLKRFTLVGIPLFHTAEAWCSQAIYKRMLAQCDAVIVNTEFEAAFVKEQATVKPEVVGVGIHPDAFLYRDGHEIRTKYQLGKSPVVGFVGRQLPSKGADRLVRAMKVVWEWNRDVCLVLAGPCPTRPDHIDTLIEGLTDFERRKIVRIDGFADKDKASIFDAFDVFALPSTEESFGIAYLEAWICRKPVIGTRIGPTQCVIKEGVDGLLVDRSDPEDLGQKIIQLLSNPHECERMGRNGFLKTSAHFTWPNVIQNIERIYLQLLTDKVPNRFMIP